MLRAALVRQRIGAMARGAQKRITIGHLARQARLKAWAAAVSITIAAHGPAQETKKPSALFAPIGAEVAGRR